MIKNRKILAKNEREYIIFCIILTQTAISCLFIVVMDDYEGCTGPFCCHPYYENTLLCACCHGLGCHNPVEHVLTEILKKLNQCCTFGEQADEKKNLTLRNNIFSRAGCSEDLPAKDNVKLIEKYVEKKRRIMTYNDLRNLLLRKN